MTTMSSSLGRNARCILGLVLLFSAAGPAAGVVFETVTVAAPSPGAVSKAALALTTDHQLLTAPVFATPSATGMIGLTRNPLTGELFTLVGIQGGQRLARLDFTTGSWTPAGDPLTITLRSIAFDSQGNLFGFALCENHYANELVQFDTNSWNITSLLGSLDSLNVPSCSTASLIAGAIAIDPADDTLYLAANDASGNLFVDRFDSFLVPTTLYQSLPGLVTGFAVTAATFSGGRIWIASGLLFYGESFFVSFEPGDVSSIAGSGPGYFAVGQSDSAPILGFVEAQQPCVSTPTSTCLFNRFRVDVSYDTRPLGGHGVAKPLLESNQSVRYGFSDPKAIELVVRMTNGCSLSSKTWRVWGGGPTSAGVQIKVTDTVTGKSKTYANTKGKLFQAFFDSTAFPCP
jgi:hypothetical protein